MHADTLYPEIVIVGCGNSVYADDGFGPAVAKELSWFMMPGNVKIVDAGLCAPQFIFPLLDPTVTQKLIVIDIVDFGAKPGSIIVLRPRYLPVGSMKDSHPGGILESLGQIDPGSRLSLSVVNQNRSPFPRCYQSFQKK